MKQFCLAIAAICAAATPVSAQDGVRAIISFNGSPDATVVTGAGGSVVDAIPSANALVANVPPGRIGRIRGAANVRSVEEDAVANATAQSTPWGISQIGANSVWSATTGSGVRVAVVDTGIQNDHPDLSPRVTLGPTYVNGTQTSKDDNGHGTHCAGTIGATNNTTGVVGVAPGCSLLAVKVLDRRGSGYYSAIINGIDYASNSSQGNARVINLSLGGTADVQALHDAIDRAVTDRGVVVCAAAGNSGDTAGNPVNYPGAYETAICVAATDSSDARAYFSTYGAQVDVAAPGLSINSTWTKSGYKTISGTSMATPHVCGSAALLIGSGLISDRSGNGFNNDEVRSRIESTSTLYPSRTDGLGYGRISASAAISAGAN